MPNVTGYITKLKNNQPDRIVDKIYNYDDKWVLVKAPTELGQREFNAMFLVSKLGQEVKPFVPFKEPNKYLDAIHSEPLYKAEG